MVFVYARDEDCEWQEASTDFLFFDLACGLSNRYAYFTYCDWRLLGIQAGVATLFPARLELLVPLSKLATSICRWKIFQRCGIIDVPSEDGIFLGWVGVRVSSLGIC